MRTGFEVEAMKMKEREKPENSTTVEDICKKIIEEMNRPKIANVGVMGFDGSIAYTLKKQVN